MNSGLDKERLGERVAGLAGRINAATCELLGLIAEADERYLWEGFPSCANWLSYQCGMGPGTASEHLRVARALGDLPLIRAAFGEGRLSYSQVRALTRAPVEVGEQVLLDLAVHATGAQLERLVRGMRKVASAEDEDEAAMRNHAEWRVDHDGALVLRARLTGEEAAAVLAALDRAYESSESRVAALVGVAQAASAGLPSVAGDRGTVTLVADVAAVQEAVALIAQVEGMTEHSSAEDSRGEADIRWEPTGVAASTVTLAMMMCDRSVDIATRLADGSLVDLGRTRRRPNARITRAVLRRHHHACAVPRCGARRHLHLHHVRHWSLGGPTSADNLVPLCRAHHRAHHLGTLPNLGVRSVPPIPTSEAPIVDDTSLASAEDVGRAVPMTPWRGGHMQYSWAIGALMQYVILNQVRQEAA